MLEEKTLYRYPFKNFQVELDRAAHSVDVIGAVGTFAAHQLGRLVGEVRQRSALVIVPDDSEAEAWRTDLEFFLSATHQILLLPTFDSTQVAHLGSQRSTVMKLNAVLAQCCWSEKPVVVVASASSYLRRVLPRLGFDQRTQLLSVGENLDRDAFTRKLVDSGYLSVPSVEDEGTFAVRGSVLDLFAVGAQLPVRIELWGDEIETMMAFNPETQRGTGIASDSLVIPPAREVFFDEATTHQVKRKMLTAAGTAGIPTRTLQPLIDDLMQGIPFVGMEAVRAFFHDALGTVADYLGEDSLVWIQEPEQCDENWRLTETQLKTRYEHSISHGELCADPHLDFLSPDDARDSLSAFRGVYSHVLENPSLGDAHRFQTPFLSTEKNGFKEAQNQREPLRPVIEYFRNAREQDQRVGVVCGQRLQRERLERICKNFGIPTLSADSFKAQRSQPEWAVELIQGTLSDSTILLDTDFVLFADSDIFGQKVRRRSTKGSDQESPFIQDFRELKIGDYVVHSDHGIGQYIGLKKLAVGAHESDFLVIAFAGQDKLYLPVYKLGRLQKYSGSGAAPKVTKLGGSGWDTVKAKARAAAEEDALALLELYAKRELADGYAFSEPNEYFRAFEDSFPFEETEDQGRSIDEVLADMSRSRPMDRLLCGDVGFGKTEVALRATMRAVLDGKQVCLLVPTTVLALQHFKSFRERFSDYPVEIGLFSRLVNARELKANVAALKTGNLDVAIGTHKLLGREIVFNDLGLLILDEEHRFGVKDKDRIKEMRANVDVLAMTATPIPRTLQMSLSGIRDLSIIKTPPAERQSVRTFVCRRTDEVVAEAIRRELGRGGQVFFVHNRVQSIQAKADWLTSLVPEARVVVGHGQMSPERLEKVMLDFTNGLFNVLISTTIIESGIDIPTANTMLIDQAENFGLAQLYQLRGRVGRGRERGYCYLLVPSELVLHKEAKARLAVIQQFTELGSGFQVASFDLEQRGAGELLGTRQKGQVQSVGVDLYAELLEDAIRTLRGEVAKVNFDPDLKFAVHARIPEDYIEADTLRLRFYKRLSNANDEEQILSLQDEIAERFGPLPGPVGNLVELMRIRCLAKQLGLSLVEQSGHSLMLTFDERTSVDAPFIFDLIQNGGGQFSVPANYKVRYDFTAQERMSTLASSRVCLQHIVERMVRE